MTRSERMLSMTVLGLLTGGEPLPEVIEALVKLLEESGEALREAHNFEMPKKEEMS